MVTNEPLARALARWSNATRLEDIPDDVRGATRLRILDTLGLVLLGRNTDAGKAILRALPSLGGASGDARVLGQRATTSAAAAAMVHGALAEAIEFDDTHNESVVHPSSPVVSAALAVAEQVGATGADLLRAVAVGNELTCRIANIAPGAFHSRGFHPTGLVGTFGAAYAASCILGLDDVETASAVGIAGSFASGILECWVDGSLTKTIHPGWAAHGGVVAAHLAKAGLTGPERVLEGKWGFFGTHLIGSGVVPDFDRAGRDLGSAWESRNISFKPYPNAHVAHGIFDAVLALRKAHGVTPAMVRSVTCHVSPHLVPIICEPRDERIRPATTALARMSLQFGIAEAVQFGRIDADSYSLEHLNDPDLLALAAKVEYAIDPSPPPRSQYKGWVDVETLDGRRLSEVREFNRGSPQNPMTAREVEDKFRKNAYFYFDRAALDKIVDDVNKIEGCKELRLLMCHAGSSSKAALFQADRC